MKKRFQEVLGQNPIVKLNGVSRERLKIALLLFDKTTAIGFGLDNETNKMVFYSEKTEGMLPLPFEMNVDGMTEFVWQWLRNIPYPKEPINTKGTNEKGWYVYCDEGGGVNGFSRGAFVAIQPEWIMGIDEDKDSETEEPDKSDTADAA